MNIAITVWGNRISPVFASAQKLVIIEVVDSQIVNKRYESINPDRILDFVELLKLNKISVLICGAIVQKSSGIIESKGVKLIPFVTGKVSEILEFYLKDRVLLPEFFMPGHGFVQKDLFC